MAFTFVFLTDQFYEDYLSCAEIKQKRDRPHVRMLIRAEGLDFAIPMRSHIRHPNAYITNAKDSCGIDYSKAVVITDHARYIDTVKQPHIRQDEFDALRGKEYIVEQGMIRYLKQYRKALTKPDVPRNAMILKYSTLQYFHQYILKGSSDQSASGK